MRLHKEKITEGGSDRITHRLTGVNTTHTTPLNPLENINTKLAIISPIIDRIGD